MIAANVRHLRKKVSQKDTLLWFSMFSMLALFILVSYALNIPEDINLGEKAQIADTELDEVRFHLLAVKKVILQYHIDGNSINARSKFEKLKQQADGQIDYLEDKAAYSSELSERIKVFRAAYNSALDAERRYLNQISRTNQSSIAHGSDDERVIVSAQNHARFLDMVQILTDTEIILHEAIARGREAFKVFQLAGVLLLISFFISLVLYQRNSSKEHTTREKNLEMTLKSIGDAVIATDVHGNVTSMNPEAERLTGWSFKDARGYALSDVFRVVNEHSGEAINNLVERVQKEKGIVVLAEDAMLIAANGNRYQIYENGAPILDDTGNIIGVVLVFRDITQEYELKNCLNEHALRLQRVIDCSMDAVIVADEKGMVDEWNPAAENMFGWSYADVKKYPLHELIIPEEFREAHLQGIKRLIEDGEKSFKSKRIESLALHRDGHTFPIELAMTSMQAENGWVFNAYIRDLTEQKKSEKTIIKNAALLQEAQHMAKLGYWDFDLQTRQLEWSDEHYQILGLNADSVKPSYEAFIQAVHPDDRELVDSAYVGSVESKTPYSLIHRVVIEGETKFVNGQCTTIFDENGNPLRSLGVLQDITEIKETEKTLLKQDRLLRETQRIAKLGYWELDLENGVLEWSDEIFLIFDIDSEASEPSYGLFINTVHPEDRERVDNAYTESLKNKKPYNIVHRIVTGNGTRIVHETCDTTFDDEGKPLRSLGLVQDITERVSNLDELRLASTMFDTHVGILITDKNGIIVRVNPAFEKMTGYSSKELVGKNPRILNSGKQSNEFYKTMWEELITTGMWQGELWNKRKDAKLYAEWLTITAVKDDTGEVKHYVGTSQDITERKQAEKHFQQVNTVIARSPVVLFRWKATEGWPVEFVSKNVSHFGYTVEELVSGKTLFSSIVHPDDLERVAREVEEYSSNGIDLFTQEYRIVSPAGEVYWIDDRTVIDRDTDGTILRYQGIVLDITERVANNGEGTVGNKHVQEDGQTDIVT